MNLKIWICSFLLLSFTSSSRPKSIKWGFTGHKEINHLAVFTLPKEMFSFYKENIDYLVENSVLPDKRRYIIKSEAPKHFIDLDHYRNDSLNMNEWIPKYWSIAKSKYTSDTLFEYGILPWNISWNMRNLEEAFSKGDPKLILKFSAELGHYISDAHVPLHTTENYNGQLTDQIGIHGLWESRLVEVFMNDYDFFVGKAKFHDDPLNKIWEVIFESHKLLPKVFDYERISTDSIGVEGKYSYELKGKNVKKVYSREFSNLYHNLLDDMVQDRMRASVLTVGSFWFTAWVNAGQPNLRGLIVDKKKLLIETNDSLKKYKNSGISIERKHEH
jgi:hypothetical protein